MRLVGYIALMILIAIVAVILNMIEGIYVGVIVPGLESVKINGTHVKAPPNPIPSLSSFAIYGIYLLIGVIFIAAIIYVIKILRETTPY